MGVKLGEGMTNNEAESTALHLALKGVASLQDQHHPQVCNTVRVFGDSQLVIKWHLGIFKKITKPSIYQ